MTGAIGLPDPDDPQQPPLETEDVGDESAAESVEPTLVEPDGEGETAVPLQPTRDDDVAGTGPRPDGAPEQTDADDEQAPKPTA